LLVMRMMTVCATNFDPPHHSRQILLAAEFVDSLSLRKSAG
jgi:hypothetical protein